MRVRKECLKRDEYGGRHALPKLRTYPLLLEAGASASEEHSTPYHGFLHLHTPLSSSQLPLSPPQSKLLVQPAAASDNVSDGATAALTANPGPSTVVNAVSINVSHIGQPATNRTLKNYVIIFLFSYKIQVVVVTLTVQFRFSVRTVPQVIWIGALNPNGCPS